MTNDVLVNVDNFVRAETARMFSDLQRDAGGVNRFKHNREPADVTHQLVVRLNRDTLYSFAVVDLAGGATLELPEAGKRYVSAMIVDENHFVNAVLHDAGRHALDQQQLGSRYVCVAVRILADPQDPADIAAAVALQDQLVIDAASAEPFVSESYDAASFDATRVHLLGLAKGLTDFTRTFGRRDEVDPVRHLIGAAAGWGGLPTSEATYVGVAPDLPVGRYSLTFRDVPVDGFWSLSVYDAAGFFVPNEDGAYTANDVTAERDADGAVTIHLGDWPSGTRNRIPLPEGWNYLIRLYRPRGEVHDGTWQPPALSTAD